MQNCTKTTFVCCPPISGTMIRAVVKARYELAIIRLNTLIRAKRWFIHIISRPVAITITKGRNVTLSSSHAMNQKINVSTAAIGQDILSQSSIKSIECVEFPEIGMEAVWKIEVENFPAFILVDDKGNDFFKQLKPCTGCTIL